MRGCCPNIHRSKQSDSIFKREVKKAILSDQSDFKLPGKVESSEAAVLKAHFVLALSAIKGEKDHCLILLYTSPLVKFHRGWKACNQQLHDSNISGFITSGDFGAPRVKAYPNAQRH